MSMPASPDSFCLAGDSSRWRTNASNLARNSGDPSSSARKRARSRVRNTLGINVCAVVVWRQSLSSAGSAKEVTVAVKCEAQLLAVRVGGGDFDLAAHDDVEFLAGIALF